MLRWAWWLHTILVVSVARISMVRSMFIIWRAAAVGGALQVGEAPRGAEEEEAHAVFVVVVVLVVLSTTIDTTSSTADACPPPPRRRLPNRDCFRPSFS